MLGHQSSALDRTGCVSHSDGLHLPSLHADHIPPLSVAQRRAALEAAAQHALSRGITMVHDMGR